MLEIGLASLLLLGFADPPAEKTGGAIVDEVRAVVDRNGKTYPYFVEYDLALPAQPRPSGGTETHRYFYETADRLYLEETRETFSSKIMVGPQTLYYAYDDVSRTHILCTGPAKLAQTTPEGWLLSHGFPLVARDQLDRDLIDNLKGFLAGSKVLRQEEAGGLRTYHITNQSGPLAVSLGPTRVEVSRPAKGKEPPKVLFRYSRGTGKPSWFGALAKLSAKFDDPKAEVQRMKGEYTWIEILKAENPGAGAIGLVALDAPSLARFVRRRGYLLPDPAVAKILEASTMQGSLELKLESGGSTYWISQEAYVSMPGKDEVLERFTRARRKLGDYVVLNIVDPAAGFNMLYYMKPGVFMIVVDPNRQKLAFENPALDRLIQSFAPPKS
jgi:hypothetical protein